MGITDVFACLGSDEEIPCCTIVLLREGSMPLKTEIGICQYYAWLAAEKPYWSRDLGPISLSIGW